LKSPLKLEQVVGEISNKVPDNRIEDLILACHTDFPLDPPALERLGAVSAPLTIVDALSADTISRMTFSGAHLEVAALERRMRENESAVNVMRDSALARLDADYQVSPQKSPKGEFETTADYRVRVEAADRTHANDRARVSAAYFNDVVTRNQLLERRMTALKAGLYPAPGPSPAFVAYDADLARLTAGIDGQEFYFSARPDRAKALHDQWNTVKVFQRYDEDETYTRYLAEARNADPVPGYPRAIAEQIELRKEEADAEALRVKAQEAAAKQKAADDARAAAQRPAGPDSAQTTTAIDRKFAAWGSTWMMDRYVNGSTQIDDIKCGPRDCVASGTFSFYRMGVAHRIGFQASVVTAGTDHYSLGRLCYSDPSTNTRDCTN
jgi:hypothetical protein